jgi:uncharacterized protein (DUF885 family)
LKGYATYLEQAYLPKARESVALSDLPNGMACYGAFLGANTRLSRTPQQAFKLGEETVSANLLQVEKLGQRRYHTSDIPTVLKAMKTNPAERFQSRDEPLTFSQGLLKRAKSITAEKLILVMPRQNVAIRPQSAFGESARSGLEVPTRTGSCQAGRLSHQAGRLDHGDAR